MFVSAHRQDLSGLPANLPIDPVQTMVREGRILGD
jgi:hypothetical protein